MRTQVIHMDSNNASNYLNFFRYEVHKNDKECRKYYEKKVKALISLVNFVANTELTDKQRQVFDLVIVKGLSSKDASDKLDIKPSTVCRHLKAIQEYMDKAYEYFKCVEHYLIGE